MNIILALILFGVLIVIIRIISPGDGGGIVGVGFLIVLFLLFRWLFGWMQSIYPGDFDMAFFKALGKALVVIISLPFRLLAMLLKAL